MAVPQPKDIREFIDGVRRKKIQYTRLVKKTRERVPMKNVRNGRRMGRSGAGKLLGQIRQILAEAAEEGIVSTNVAAMVKLKNEPSTEEAWTFLTLEEQEAVLSGDEIPEWGRDLIARGPRLGRPSRHSTASPPLFQGVSNACGLPSGWAISHT